MSPSLVEIERIRGMASGHTVEEALTHWKLATSEMARCEDWLSIAFAIARRQRICGNA